MQTLWWQAAGTILLGNLIVPMPMLLNAHQTRSSGSVSGSGKILVGLLGANLRALLRALVACGWFGIQTWIGGQAIASLFGIVSGVVWLGAAAHPENHPGLFLLLLAAQHDASEEGEGRHPHRDDVRPSLCGHKP